MNELVERLKASLNLGSDFFLKSLESENTCKPTPDKWSKKEILGHLIDSAINNLQRFTEIQFVSKPYKIRPYNQNGLVESNNYQNAETREIVNLWLSLNHRILKVILLQNTTTLGYKIELDKGEIVDLRFLIEDYVEHLEHHLKQIIKN
ncbi:DinB family protein [Seonamhaeicola sp. MEBiC1930]|uniref:DinB family protein n=1 Tax=Seonamhaeicola sp. MEBiC01930 TaxID=2976768 RepID=UPI00324CCB44